jgi:hypothetical protein
MAKPFEKGRKCPNGMRQENTSWKEDYKNVKWSELANTEFTSGFVTNSPVPQRDGCADRLINFVWKTLTMEFIIILH